MCAKLNDNIAMEPKDSNIFHYFMCLYAPALMTKQEKFTNTTAPAVNKKEKKRQRTSETQPQFFVWNGTKKERKKITTKTTTKMMTKCRSRRPATRPRNYIHKTSCVFIIQNFFQIYFIFTHRYTSRKTLCEE